MARLPTKLPTADTQTPTPTSARYNPPNYRHQTRWFSCLRTIGLSDATNAPIVRPVCTKNHRARWRLTLQRARKAVVSAAHCLFSPTAATPRPPYYHQRYRRK